MTEREFWLVPLVLIASFWVTLMVIIFGPSVARFLWDHTMDIARALGGCGG